MATIRSGLGGMIQLNNGLVLPIADWSIVPVPSNHEAISYASAMVEIRRDIVKSFGVPKHFISACVEEPVTIDSLKQLLGPAPNEDGGVRFTAEGGWVQRPSAN